VVTKKNNYWSATISTKSSDSAALEASLACEEVECELKGDELFVTICGTSASDLRAKYNSTMRSLRAASETLAVIN
tara:strand:+ start:448 stop:675 length:228 start_codon:yes stop_codon:yes gene_type:complete